MTDAASAGLVPPVSPTDPQMWVDFLALCDFGGRLAGSASEAAALDFAEKRLAAVPGATFRAEPVEYSGWRCRTAQLTHAATGVSLPCTPLLGTAATAGVVAEVVDLGLGQPEDFERHANRIRGRIVMVRHEYPFAAGHVHRRVKLGLARQMDAVGFLIAHPENGIGPVSGSSGRNGGAGIPALGIGAEAADVFRPSPDGTLPTARMVIDGEDHPARTRMLIADLPGQRSDWVVVSAHIDGHPHGESAIDNATGVAVTLGLARLLAAARAEMSARFTNMPVQRRGMGSRRIAHLARTHGRGRAAVDGHQHQSQLSRRRLRIDRAHVRLRTA